MPKLSVLELTQDILSDMNSDNVNSINDTAESLQVAQIIKTTYYEIIHETSWPHLNRLIEITGLGDVLTPTHMKLNDDVMSIDWVKYDQRESSSTDIRYIDVKYLTPSEFLSRVMSRSSSQANITEVTDINGASLLIQTDKHPDYYTSFDDEYIVFDSLDKDFDTTLQTSRTQVFGKVEPSFTLSDTFVPDLPSHAFSFLLAEAKSAAFNSLVQVPNAKEEQRSRRQRNYLSRSRWRTNGGIQYSDFGR